MRAGHRVCRLAPEFGIRLQLEVSSPGREEDSRRNGADNQQDLPLHPATLVQGHNDRSIPAITSVRPGRSVGSEDGPGAQGSAVGGCLDVGPERVAGGGGHAGGVDQTPLEEPTLGGDPVKLRVAPGTPSGRVLRVKGRGVHSAKGPGDLLAEVQVAVPSHLDDAAREALERFHELEPKDNPRADLMSRARG